MCCVLYPLDEFTIHQLFPIHNCKIVASFEHDYCKKTAQTLHILHKKSARELQVLGVVMEKEIYEAMSKATYYKDLILSIKQEIKARNLTQQEVYDLLTEKGFYISKDTLGHLLRKGSEEKKYRFEGCLQALAAVFIVEKTPVPVEELDSVKEAQQYIDQIEALQAVAQVKQTVIEDLQADLQSDLPSPSELLPKIEDLQASSEIRQEMLEDLKKSIEELKKTIGWQQRRIEQLEEKKRQLLARDDAILAAFREEAKRSTDHLLAEIDFLLTEIEYLRQENVRKSKIVDKYFSTM